MLSDKSIRRDVGVGGARRLVLGLRKVVSKFYRPKLNVVLNEKLKDISFSILGNNCLAGVFYHDAGLQFTSPTINTAMDAPDFLTFLENPKHYFEVPMHFVSFEGHNYPIAQIDDIEVRFVHYSTQEEAEQKWRERAERIVWDNLYIVATNHDGFDTKDRLERFDKLPYKNKIMFVSKEYPEYDWAILVPQFKNRFQVRIMTAFANFRGQRYYETCFDIAEWIRKSSC